MLNYKRSGIGEPLVLIHGYLETNRIYEYCFNQLAENYTVIAVDLPGHGESPIKPDTKTVYDYAKKIIDLLQSLKIERATWVGHSFGGYITLAAIEKYRQYLYKAALVYSSPAADDEWSKKNREISIQAIKTDGVVSFANKQVPSYFAADSKPEVVKFALELAYETSDEGAIRALEAMRDRHEQTLLLKQVDIPVLLLKGTKDPWDGNFSVTSPSHYVKVAQTDTSHMGMLDNPEEFLSVLEEWLKHS